MLFAILVFWCDNTLMSANSPNFFLCYYCIVALNSIIGKVHLVIRLRYVCLHYIYTYEVYSVHTHMATFAKSPLKILQRCFYTFEFYGASLLFRPKTKHLDDSWDKRSREN